jgi:molecular chaperone GrpE
MHAAPFSGGREPRLDVPPMSNKAEEEKGEPSAAATPGGGAAGAAPGNQGPDLGAELEKAKAEVAEYKDKALRAVAELENFRRRAEKEREDVAKYAISNFAREMLPVADNLRRALDSQPSVDGEAAAPLKAFIAGVELTERELLAAFERFGLKKIEPMGQPFDHNFHQAMFEIEDAGQPAGTVVQVMQAGYLLKDRLLRPALVGVSKGGPARTAEGRAEAAASSAANEAYGAAPGGEGHTVDTKA